MKTHRSLYVPWKPQRMAALKPNRTQMETRVSWREPRWQAKTWQCKRPSWSWIAKGCKRPRAVGAGEQSCRFPKIQAAAAAALSAGSHSTGTQRCFSFYFPTASYKDKSKGPQVNFKPHLWKLANYWPNFKRVKTKLQKNVRWRNMSLILHCRKWPMITEWTLGKGTTSCS